MVTNSVLLCVKRNKASKKRFKTLFFQGREKIRELTFIQYDRGYQEALALPHSSI